MYHVKVHHVLCTKLFQKMFRLNGHVLRQKTQKLGHVNMSP